MSAPAAPARARILAGDQCDQCGGQLGYLGRQIVCILCRTPVDPRHELQVQFDRDWAARDERDRAEQERQRQAPPPTPPLPYADFTAKLLGDLMAELHELRGRVVTVTEQVSTLQGRLSVLEAPVSKTARKG